VWINYSNAASASTYYNVRVCADILPCVRFVHCTVDAPWMISLPPCRMMGMCGTVGRYVKKMTSAPGTSLIASFDMNGTLQFI